MLVFKFGGASVRSSEAVQNIGDILSRYQNEDIVVVISAMGKTTNALEGIVRKYFNAKGESTVGNGQLAYFDESMDEQLESFNPLNDKNDLWLDFEKLRSFHFKIVNQLIPSPKNKIFAALNIMFDNLLVRLKQEPSMDFDYEYDQIVSFGEILSTKIVSLYLNEMGVENQWLDVRRLLKTDNNYRDARIDWDLSEKQVVSTVDFNKNRLYITQGFIGATRTNLTTTFGREGSDFSAAVFANLLNAEKLVIWKDVEGIYNADPKQFDNPQKVPALSYEQAVEMAYFGAKVIHPKTIKPIRNKKIPLYVKSFINPDAEGTVIASSEQVEALSKSAGKVPSYIRKDNQVLLQLATSDFSFMAEANLSTLFGVLTEHKVRVNMIQNEAIHFKICIDYNDSKFEELVAALKEDFELSYERNLVLATVTDFTEEAILRITQGYSIVVRENNTHTVRFVLRKNE